MKSFKKITVNAKDLKIEMKNFGIKVIRCAKSKTGVSIVINDIEGNEELFKSFCKKNDLKSNPMVEKMYSVASIKGDFLQYGTLYKFEQIYKSI